MGPHLRMYGSVGWSIGESLLVVTGSKRAGILVALAEQRGSTVSVDALLTRFWQNPPASGANAVQRHISSLRSQLVHAGVTQPIVESVPGGYRLSRSVDTDLHVLDTDIHQYSLNHDVQVTWWEEPLIGADYEATLALRQRLDQLSDQALAIWVGQMAPQNAALVSDRLETILAHSPDRTAVADLRVAHQPGDSLQMSSASAVDGLRQVAGFWAAGQSSAALDVLEEPELEVPEDTKRRLCRALIWLEPDDAWSRHLFSLVVEEGISDRAQHERAVVSLDSRAFEAQPDGRDRAADEVATSANNEARLRALRVQYMCSLSNPCDDGSDDVIESIRAIDLPDARVEAARFAFLNSLRRLRYETAADDLKHYEKVVAHEWFGTGDDFAQMARSVLQRSVDDEVAAAFGPTRATLPSFMTDRWAYHVADSVWRLLKFPAGGELRIAELHIAAETMSWSAAQAMHLLRDHHAGEDVGDRAASMAQALPGLVREKQFLLLPVALCVVAETIGGSGIAHEASVAIEPWSGQALGMWPVDAFLGPADVWLDRLSSI